MPRTYKKLPGCRRYQDYSTEQLNEAINLVQLNRMSVKKAAEMKQIPRRTLANKIKHLHLQNIGAPTQIAPEIERDLVDVVIACAEYGSPLTMLDIRFIMKHYLDREGMKMPKFKENLPGVEWGRNFLSRHRSLLSERHCQNIKKVRAEKTKEEFEKYFKNLETSIENIPPERILNYDETNLSDDPGSKKHVFRRGCKYPERIMNSTKSSISIMYSVTASGKVLPPYVVYKAERLYDQWCISGPPGTRYNRSKSGWFDGPCFTNWFETIVLPWAKSETGTKVLIGDNLSSHININVLRECQKHDIRFTFLPPNSTHITQPLDISFFRPLKMAWREILVQYKMKNPRDSVLNKSIFPRLLTILMEKIKLNEKKNIINGFRKAGICPLNKHAVIKLLPEEKTENIKEQIGDTVVSYLKYLRNPSQQNVPKRKKMVHIEPGKSLSAEDVERALAKKTSQLNKKLKTATNEALFSNDFDVEPGPSNCDKETPSGSYTNRNSADQRFEIEEECESEVDSDIENKYPDDIKHNRGHKNQLIEDDKASPTIESFAVIAFRTKKTVRHYIGKIMDKEDIFYVVKFLRRSNNSFVFPQVDDISHVALEDIIKILPEPNRLSSSRDIFNFDIDLSQFNFS